MVQKHLLSSMLTVAAAQAAIDPANFTAALQQLPILAQRAVNSGDVPGLSIAVVYNGTVQVSSPLWSYRCARSCTSRVQVEFVVMALRGKRSRRLPTDNYLSTRKDLVFV
jgi:hypothetical protein